MESQIKLLIRTEEDLYRRILNICDVNTTPFTNVRSVVT